jgi:ABC-type glycerol-3-phosphate transport system substrate-binding protein
MPEIIAQGLNGYLIDMEGPTGDPQNIEAWQRAIGWIEDGLIKPEDCRKDAVEHFDRMVAANRYLALFLR